jgi:PEP-CTERM motif
MKRFALLMSVLTLLAAQAWVFGASYEDAKGPKGSATAVKPEKKTEKKTENRKTIPVPEPTTITLLGAAAGVAVARKLWRNRQR